MPATPTLAAALVIQPLSSRQTPHQRRNGAVFQQNVCSINCRKQSSLLLAKELPAAAGVNEHCC
jgi:hypothetical protein